MPLSHSPEWQKLAQLAQAAEQQHITSLFDQNPTRADDYCITLDGLYFDYSKTNINDEARDALLHLAKAQNIEALRDDMAKGARINTSEGRAVLHTALRRPSSDNVEIDGHNVMDEIHDTLHQMERFCQAVHSGEWRGYSDKPITDIINIGIGGSDLGPYMVCEALKPFQKENINSHFVSNIDGAALHEVLQKINPERCLFLIASKSFTTEETLKNAQTARQWFLAQDGTNEPDIAKHFVAMSTNEAATKAFGIARENLFGFGDYVGGRFSLWSAIGLPIALGLGFEHFRALLDGAYEMDQHFLTAPAAQNMPILLGLIGVWHRNFCNYPSLAVLPYAQNLWALPAYLQQMDMESNGKSVGKNGLTLAHDTGPIVFGAAGTNGQHAFYQLIHQSREVIPCEFIAVKQSLSPYSDHHDGLLSHVIAQSRALMIGRSIEQSDGAAEKYFPGNRPSLTLLLDRLDPKHLGMLLALYEHKIFVQGAIWGLNSYDQPGVELGKILAKEIAGFMQDKAAETAKLDPSSIKLLKMIEKA